MRRAPLDFDASGARHTLFIAFENTDEWRSVVQRALDVSYLPDSLLVDGDRGGRREDYWGVVGRLAARWPCRSEGLRVRAGAEIGYAPETPTAEAVDLADSVDGLAWQGSASLMDLRPGHSLGLNYGRTGAGWLLSPQFRPNERLLEIRYAGHLPGIPRLEARIRWRKELEQRLAAGRRREEIDFFVRATWRFTVREP